MENQTKKKIVELLQPVMESLGVTSDDLSTSESLLNQGILDSMSFLEFIVSIESAFNVNLDFSELDPSEFTSIDNIAKLIENEN